jgi:hypothetical protein
MAGDVTVLITQGYTISHTRGRTTKDWSIVYLTDYQAPTLPVILHGVKVLIYDKEKPLLKNKLIRLNQGKVELISCTTD